MVGNRSEMKVGAVITKHAQKLKIVQVFDERVFPKFAVPNPEYTFTAPIRQMISGFYDIMAHILEQCFSGDDDKTSDYNAEGLLRALIVSAKMQFEIQWIMKKEATSCGRKRGR